MRKKLQYMSAMLLGVASTGSLFAGDQLFDFNSGDPTPPPGFIIYGNHANLAYQVSDGNPANGGYLQLTDANAGSESCAIVFPDVDLFTNTLGTVISLPIKSFRIEADLRIGNGTRRPADGFSISFARPTDRVVLGALQPTPVWQGWAGGDSPAVANDPNGNGNPESGTRTGLAISFDTWQGNWLNTTDGGAVTNAGGSNDREGISIRLDDRTLDQNSLGNRNGGCFITELNPGDPCIATSQAAIDSMQTGPWSGASSATGDGGVSDKSYNLLSWQKFTAEINEAKQVTVTWKGNILLDHYQLTNYPTSQGRVVLGARTGGSWEHTHIDNIHVTTVPAYQPILDPVTPVTVRSNGFTINILDIATALCTNFSAVSMDNIDITSGIVFSNNAPVSAHGIFTMTTNFIPRSSHTLSITYKDSLGGTYTYPATFVVPQFLVVDPGLAIDLAQIDTSAVGVKVRSWQSRRYEPNNLNWAEEQMAGLRGPNVSDQTGASGGLFNWAGPIHVSNGGGGAFFPGTATNWTAFGIGATTGNADNSAVEMTGYLYFPAGGDYAMYLGSDDGYRLTLGHNPFDRMSPYLASDYNGGRGQAEPGDPFTIVVPKAGAYPFRLLWENGNGGADLQWMTAIPGTTNYALINDVTNPASVLVYSTALPSANLSAYVKRANPVRDGGNVVFYQPLLVELGDGSGTRTVNQSSIALAVDGVAQTLQFSKPDGSTTRLVTQMGNNVWNVGAHTNLLTFADNAGSNYTYTWTFTVINVPATNAIAIPVENMVAASAIDSNQRGYRIKTYQSPHQSPNVLSWTEMQLQGLHGPNVASQSQMAAGGYAPWGDFNVAEGDGTLDLRYSFTAAGANNGDNGEYNYYKLLTDVGFSIGENAWWSWAGINGVFRFGTPGMADQKAESSAMDIGTWLVFPDAGYYIIHVNTDDGCKLISPRGYPFGKLGTTLINDNVGRGVAGPSGGQVGGSYCAISIPAAGAYPFRLVYENGGTDGGIEWSIYKKLPDGGMAKLPVNDLSDNNSIKAYQTLTSGDVQTPYVSYANPPYDHREQAFWAPIVVEMTDAPSKTINTSTIQLTTDGLATSFTRTSPSAGVTRIVQNNPYWGPVGRAHTNVLTFQDNSGSTYTYTWPFTVMNLMQAQGNQPGIVVEVPASSMVPVSSVDHTKPGFRVYPFQSMTESHGNTVQWMEEHILGLHGANGADLSLAVNGQYYTNNDVIDFADGYNHGPGASGYDVDSANGEYRYNYAFSRFGLQPKGGGVNTNDVTLMFAGYMEFERPGLYAMTVNSDDGFKVSVPFANPKSQAGTTLGWISAGRGNWTGGGFGPHDSVTHFVFNIPTAGAYPMRMIWENGGGGINVEWTVYQYMPDGSVARLLVGDTNTVGALKVYQDSSMAGPYVASMNPTLPYTLIGDGLQTMALNRGNNLTINLQDGNTALDTSSLSLTFAGVAQPLSFTQNGTLTSVVRYGTNALPSGFYGPAVFSYKDTAGRTYTMNWTLINQDYYGTVVGGYPLGSGDATKPGFLVRPFQAEVLGTVNVPTRIASMEQLLAGIWTNVNVANLTSNTVNGYFVRNGTGPQDGVINFNIPGANIGDFTTNNGYADMQFPGLPTLGSTAQNNGYNSFAEEILTYVEFPTNGTYVMGVNSDDGFRVTRGWGAPQNKGALIVNSPASIAGVKRANLPALNSRQLTNAISGELVMALGVGNGSTNPQEGCGDLSNASQLAGKIALVLRGTCNERIKVQNAAAAGALAVVIVTDRPVNTPADGWFPYEAGVTPIQAIPHITISLADGLALASTLSNSVVHVTLSPLDFQVNPPADSPVLGQADFGKGSGDVLFNVTVPQAGVYPLRLMWFQGGGGGNCEWFSMVNGQRVLLNDATSTNGPALKAYFGLTTVPSLAMQINNNTATVNYTGTLQTATDISGPWTDVYGQPPYVAPVGTVGNRFFRSR